MKPNSKKSGSRARKTSEYFDEIVSIVSPRRAFERKRFRFGYDALDSSRLRKKRTGIGGTGDKQLTERNLYRLREICREMGRNNPLVKGILRTERNGVVGTGPKIEARTGDEKLNKDIEAAFAEEMIQRPCDVTGRFSFNKLIRILYLTYRRDGDAAVIFTDYGLQMVEGEQIGTPYGRKENEHLEVVNGIAYSKKTKEVIGYYIGEPDKWGYIKSASFQKYKAEFVYHMFNPDRTSQSRGEPVLTPSINFIDTLCDYIDAELVAAKVNACFSMFIAQEYSDMPEPYTKGVSDTGKDEDDEQLEHIQPGIIIRGEPGEKAEGIGQTRPGSLFDPFVLRMLTFIGRPLCMPLMLIGLDFSGVTFMNARIAYQEARDNWTGEQEDVIKPFASRTYRWWLQRKIDDGTFKLRKNVNIFGHEIICKRWPYVDPFKEAKADEFQVKLGTKNRTRICARQGDDFKEITEQLIEEEKIRAKGGLPKLGEKQNAV